MKTLRFYSIILLTLNMAQLSFAEPRTVDQVWQKIKSASPELQAARLQAEASKASTARAKRHWLPKLYMEARTYQTNDPGAVFFGLIQQKDLQNSDFSADAINNPEAQTFTRGAIGIDWPIFEGGIKQAQTEALELQLTAQQYNFQQSQISQYSRVVSAYGAISAIEQFNSQLKVLKNEVERLVQNYQLGSRANPVGYSGLLGLKSLNNRLAGLSQQYAAQNAGLYLELQHLGYDEKSWSPEVIAVLSFSNQYLPVVVGSQSSFGLQSLNQITAARKKSVEISKGQHLPQIGAFAENTIFQGERDTANAYAAGVYLRWNLFDSNLYGAVHETKLQVAAAEKQYEAAAHAERSQQESLQLSIVSLRENVQLLNESEKLLLEQTKVTGTLFKNGSINALQFVEVLSRRTDVLVQKTDAELALLKTMSQAFAQSQNQIPLEVTK